MLMWGLRTHSFNLKRVFQKNITPYFSIFKKFLESLNNYFL